MSCRICGGSTQTVDIIKGVYSNLVTEKCTKCGNVTKRTIRKPTK